MHSANKDREREVEKYAANVKYMDCRCLKKMSTGRIYPRNTPQKNTPLPWIIYYIIKIVLKLKHYF